MCLLADLCNHTWIPECGQERSDNSVRLFIDECDLWEYSCDNNLHYEILNYSECFTGVQSCPTTIPCPSMPTCPNHRFHRMGQRFFFVSEARRMARPIATTKPNLPKHMLHGKRRYTPTPRCARARCQGNNKKTTIRRTILKNSNIKRTKKYPTTKRMANVKRKMISIKRDTIVMRRETVLKNGKMFVKVVKGLASKTTGTRTKEDSDFLEK